MKRSFFGEHDYGICDLARDHAEDNMGHQEHSRVSSTVFRAVDVVAGAAHRVKSSLHNFFDELSTANGDRSGRNTDIHDL